MTAIQDRLGLSHTDPDDLSVSPVVTVATRALVDGLVARPSDKRRVFARTTFLTEHLNSDLLCYIHRAALDGEVPSAVLGMFRVVGIWLGTPGSTPDRARYVPPPAAEIPLLIDRLLTKWREGYGTLRAASRAQCFAAIADFHYEFLRIHPFTDGNGRVARLLLEQQARELLDIDRHIILENSAAYQASLTSAHDGNRDELYRLLSQSLFGTWTPEG